MSLGEGDVGRSVVRYGGEGVGPGEELTAAEAEGGKGGNARQEGRGTAMCKRDADNPKRRPQTCVI